MPLTPVCTFTAILAFPLSHTKFESRDMLRFERGVGGVCPTHALLVRVSQSNTDERREDKHTKNVIVLALGALDRMGNLPFLFCCLRGRLKMYFVCVIGINCVAGIVCERFGFEEGDGREEELCVWNRKIRTLSKLTGTRSQILPVGHSQTSCCYCLFTSRR